MMLSVLLRAALPAGAAGLLSLGVAGPDDGAASAPSLRTQQVSAAVTDCNLHCDHCPDPDYHHTHNQFAGGSQGLMHSNCIPGGCGVHGCQSEDDEEDLASAGRILEWIASGDTESLRSEVARPASRIRVAAPRLALIVLGCDGAPFAFVPVSPRYLAAVAD